MCVQDLWGQWHKIKIWERFLPVKEAVERSYHSPGIAAAYFFWKRTVLNCLVKTVNVRGGYRLCTIFVHTVETGQRTVVTAIQKGILWTFWFWVIVIRYYTGEPCRPLGFPWDSSLFRGLHRARIEPAGPFRKERANSPGSILSFSTVMYIVVKILLFTVHSYIAEIIIGVSSICSFNLGTSCTLSL